MGDFPVFGNCPPTFLPFSGRPRFLLVFPSWPIHQARLDSTDARSSVRPNEGSLSPHVVVSQTLGEFSVNSAGSVISLAVIGPDLAVVMHIPKMRLKLNFRTVFCHQAPRRGDPPARDPWPEREASVPLRHGGRQAVLDQVVPERARVLQVPANGQPEDDRLQRERDQRRREYSHAQSWGDLDRSIALQGLKFKSVCTTCVRTLARSPMGSTSLSFSPGRPIHFCPKGVQESGRRRSRDYSLCSRVTSQQSTVLAEFSVRERIFLSVLLAAAGYAIINSS